MDEQDKLWSTLSKKGKKIILQEYNNLCIKFKEYGIVEVGNRIKYLEKLFGKNNLKIPDAVIKTWDDVVKYKNQNPKLKKIVDEHDKLLSKLSCSDSTIVNKISATYKIYQLIELFYGGNITKVEWRDPSIDKFAVCCNAGKLEDIDIVNVTSTVYPVAFNSGVYRTEFLKHLDNKTLIRLLYLG